MRRYAQAVVLFLLGGMQVKLVVTGAFARYVGSGYAALLAISGVALLVIAAVTVWRDLRSALRSAAEATPTGLHLDGLFGSDRERAARTALDPEARPTSPATPSPPAVPVEPSDVDYRSRALAAGRAAAAHEGLGDSPAAVAGEPEPVAMAVPTAVFATVAPTAVAASAARTVTAPPRRTAPVVAGGSWGGWALLAVALTVLMLAPPALGPLAASRAGTLTGVAPRADAPPPGDPASMSLAEYVAHAAAGAPALSGRRVRLVGFVMAGPRGEPYLARLVIGCCAAGARSVKVGLTGDLPGVLTPGWWVEVVGTYTDRRDLDPVNGASIPYLSVVSVTQVAPPADPYER